MNSSFLGMTVNERLYVAGLSDAFDEAVVQGNANEVRRILHLVKLEEDSIRSILSDLKMSAR